MFELLGVLGVIVGIVYAAALVFGIIFCWRLSFKEGFSCFLILSIIRLNQLLSPLYMDSLIESNRNLPDGLTIGMIFGLYSSLIYFLEALAFILLIWGLYRLLKRRNVQLQE